MGELPTLAPAPTTITPARRYLQNRLAYRKGSHAPGVANAARTRRCVEATRRLCSNFALASPLASPNFVRNPEFNRSHRCGEKKIRPAYSIVRAHRASAKYVASNAVRGTGSTDSRGNGSTDGA